MGREINRLLNDSCVTTDAQSMLRLCLVFIKVTYYATSLPTYSLLLLILFIL